MYNLILVALFSIALPKVCWASKESKTLPARPNLALILWDQESFDELPKALGSKLSRKPVAEMLKTLREAGSSAIFLDWGYADRPDDKEDSVNLKQEIKAYSDPRTRTKLYLCNTENFPGLKPDEEIYSGNLNLASCRYYFFETVRKNTNLTYCAPEPGDIRSYMSPDPKNEDYEKNLACQSRHINISAKILSDLGISISPSDFNTDDIGEDPALERRGMKVPYFSDYPATYKLKDILSGKVDKEIFRNKVVYFGAAYGKADIQLFDGKNQYGIYMHVYSFLTLVNKYFGISTAGDFK